MASGTGRTSAALVVAAGVLYGTTGTISFDNANIEDFVILRSDGTPVYIERVRGPKRADLAKCRTCGYVIGDGQFWGLAQGVWLHTNGAVSCQGSKVTYWRWL